MLKDILQKIGLTRGESDVYLTLLKLGNTTTGSLIKDSGVSRSKVYEVLERLKQKGLATEMIKQNTRYFEATTPKRILDYLKKEKQELEQKEKEAEDLIPKLAKLQQLNLEKQEAKVYTGFEGWKTAFNELLDYMDEGEEYIAFAVDPKELKDKRVQLFFRNYHLRREEKKVKVRLLMRPGSKEIMDRNFAKMKSLKYRFSDTNFPTNITINKDRIGISVWGESPVAFIIQSKQVADRYRESFEGLWKKAK